MIDAQARYSARLHYEQVRFLSFVAKIQVPNMKRLHGLKTAPDFFFKIAQ